MQTPTESSPVAFVSVPTPSPYTSATLSTPAKTDLSVLVHFLLLFRKPLSLPLHALLHNLPEASLLSQAGPPHTALTAFLSTATASSPKALHAVLTALPTPEARLAHLRELADAASGHALLRAHLHSDDGRVLPAARLRPSACDRARVRYTWVRGPDGCASDRVLAESSTGPRVLRAADLPRVIARLEAPPRRRANLLTTGWLRERAERAADRALRIEVAEEDRVRAEEEAEQSRLKRIDRAKKQVGLFGGVEVDLLKCGRGRRERNKVCYQDTVEEDFPEEEEEEVAEDEGDEFVMDDEETGESDDSDEESDDSGQESDIVDSEDENVREVSRSSRPAALGRRRVMSAARVTRARATDEEGMDVERPMRKCRRMTREST